MHEMAYLVTFSNQNSLLYHVHVIFFLFYRKQFISGRKRTKYSTRKRSGSQEVHHLISLQEMSGWSLSIPPRPSHHPASAGASFQNSSCARKMALANAPVAVVAAPPPSPGRRPFPLPSPCHSGKSVAQRPSVSCTHADHSGHRRLSY